MEYNTYPETYTNFENCILCLKLFGNYCIYLI